MRHAGALGRARRLHPLPTATTTRKLDLHAEPGLEAGFFWKFAKRILAGACLAGLFSLKSCKAVAMERANRYQGRAAIKHGLVSSEYSLIHVGF